MNSMNKRLHCEQQQKQSHEPQLRGEGVRKNKGLGKNQGRRERCG
jgi:hypothetical protein